MGQIADLAVTAHGNSKAHGFYDTVLDKAYSQEAETAKRIALIMSELGELLEAVRLPISALSEKAAGFTCAEEEAADVFIRLLDLCGWLGWDLEGATKAKMAYNAKRPYKHGKAF